MFFFFFSSRRRHTRYWRDWSSDVCSSDLDLPPLGIAGFDEGLAEEFFRALASTAKLTLHVNVEAGTNGHHMVEAAFKAVARALRQAVAIDPEESGVPSTKGLL